MLDLSRLRLKKESSRNAFQNRLLEYEHRQNEFTQVRAYADERDTYVSLLVAIQIIVVELGALYRRTKTLKNGWRDLRLIQSRLTDLGVRLMMTMPDNQQAAMAHAANALTYRIGVIKASGSDATSETCIAVRRSDLMELMKSVEDKCLTCDLDKIGEMKCPLRKALDTIGSDVDHKDGCGYKFI